MFQELRLIFQANTRIERYEFSNEFYSCKMEENSSVSEHILRMSGYHMLGNVVISKKILRTRKIMVMHSNERGECDLRTLVDRQRKC